MKRALAILLLVPLWVSAATSITQHGVTWTFDADETTGVYANGEAWVVGPVTITNISPASTLSGGRTINGSVLNLTIGETQGFDSAMYGIYGPDYSSALNVARPGGNDLTDANPLTITSGKLLSSISYATAGARPQLQRVSVLTVVGSAPSSNSFRPPLYGTNVSSTWTTNDLDWSALKTATLPANQVALATVQGYFDGSLVDGNSSPLTQQYYHPRYPMDLTGGYGREIALAVGQGLIAANADYTYAQKVPIVVGLVQLGIDIQAQSAGGQEWHNNGGHNQGRKPALVFAAVMLGQESAWATNIASSGGRLWHEDGQTFIVDLTDVGKYVYDQSPDRPRVTYEQFHVGTADWGVEHDGAEQYDGSNWTTIYRDTCASGTFSCWLAMTMMGLESVWNDPAFFLYWDRATVEYFLDYTGANQYTTAERYQWSAWRETQLTRPINPGAVTATGGTGGTVELTWENDSTIETGTIVQYRSNPDSEDYTTFTVTDENATGATVSGLSDGVTYWFRVGNTNSATGEFSGWSTGDEAAPSGSDTTPPTISSVSASPSTTSATVTWDTSESATSGLQWGLTTSYGSSSTNSSGVTSHSLSATGLSASTTYHFIVHSSDAAGNHSQSADATFVTASAGGGEEGSTGGTNWNIGSLRAGRVQRP